METTANNRQAENGHGDGLLAPRAEMGFAIGSGITYAAGMATEYLFDTPGWVPTTLFLATYVLGGFFTVRSAVETIRRGRFEVDFLMLVAAVGAAAVGKWAEGSVLLFLFSLGHALEEYAMSRAERSIAALGELEPRTALVRRGPDRVEEIDVADLRVGDTVVVLPNSRLSADGIVVAGTSAIDESSVTGESMPVDKQPVADAQAAVAGRGPVSESHRVFAGTLNGSGALEVLVTNRAEDSTLARVIAMVRDTDTQKSPTQRFIDRFQLVYVPAVIAGVLTVIGFGALALSEPFADSFYRGMVVLVAASPCALAIATPSAVLAGVARAAQAGVLAKGGGPLESLGRVKAIAFDKTGTLTWGQPRVTDIVPVRPELRERLVTTVVAVESFSDHPLAAAITRDLAGEVASGTESVAEEVNSVTGRGVTARVDGHPTEIGNLTMFEELDPAGVPEQVAATVDRLHALGRTTMIVRHGGVYLGVLGVMDTPRAEAASVIEQLRGLGITDMVVISGDNQRVADAVADGLGLDAAHGGLLPEDKVSMIARLNAKGGTAMVGDGVNDAPAMVNSSVGIAMGAGGSAVALETADVALMSDDIGRLPFAVALSRRTAAIIRQNLTVALVIVAALVPATLIGLPIGPAVFIHEGSTLLVVANALRLLRFRRGAEHAGIAHEPRPA
ncbi:heavy metal translocating P-type ATPase [Nocardia seriolae]|uniref:ATPase n=1 Tax=Nocardia seriolae TaxID=37332 RepID=A0A0B8N2B7_9NOCA|nr:heavy metal translocating P-type ATPase [Nocardia seriolae]APA98814.1 Cadmium-exporting ATPase [Nocardia seriolae]MTJ63885.1 heavy metal translocating P-type ATPase [Nocardia seriolae]MTJ71484.1 heavy metal translocating P-type ATPase [Nocardia seriolae]MTJ88444.1 heavy metal translocating P-type ATPase [Nocardia seriolae]MTK32429.1 heavy metal translocating P-type ATPase [Nocardia seriolae]